MIDSDTATQLLLGHYGLNSKLDRLGGDRDANFRVEMDGVPRYVFKVMHPQSRQEDVALQCTTLDWLADSSLNLPSVARSLRGTAEPFNSVI